MNNRLYRRSVTTGLHWIVIVAALVGSSGLMAQPSPTYAASKADGAAAVPGANNFAVYLPVVMHGSPQPAETLTPWQQALQVSLEERKQSGLPVPASVAYEYDVVTTPAAGASGGTPQRITITGKTVIQFASPEQAGYAEWPAAIVGDALPPNATGFVKPGDYSDTIREALAQSFPGIWDRYTFGQEPRRYTLVETIDVVYPQELTQSPAWAAAADSTSLEEILLGFTYPGPAIDYTIGDSWDECVLGICVTIASARAGLALDWSLGLRLPTRISLTAPDLMERGAAYGLASALTPLDWSGASYLGAGAPGEGGNEFVLRFEFFVGFKVEILGIEVIGWNLDTNFDKSRSFTTPFGSGNSFPIPPFDLDPDETGLKWGWSWAWLGVGFTMEPFLGSDRITADWQVLAGCSAPSNGQITYANPDTPVNFGPATACDGTTAQVRLTNFRYWFTQFLIKLNGNIQFEVFGYGGKLGSFHIADFDLSGLTGGLWVGAHAGTDNAVERLIPILDTIPPVTTASQAGASTVCATNSLFVGSATVTLAANEPATTRYRVRPFGGDLGAWQIYSAPFVITTEGANTLDFYSTDTAGNVEATKSITVKVTNVPATPVLDDFNRADGNVGANWRGATLLDLYRIVGQQLDVGLGGPLYWQAATFGADQQAFVTLTRTDPNSDCHSLILKAQNYDWTAGAILVSYDAATQSIPVEVRANWNWHTVLRVPMALNQGDILGARATPAGKVRVYVNCEFIGEADTTGVAGSFYTSRGGAIGLWLRDAVNAIVDNFGGGDHAP